MIKERKIFEKVISGGQTGADQRALDAALELVFWVLIGILGLAHQSALAVSYPSGCRAEGFATKH